MIWIWPLAYDCGSWPMIASGLWLWPIAYDFTHDCGPLHMIVTHGLLLLHTTHDCISWPMIMASANITANYTKNLTLRKPWLWPLAYDCCPACLYSMHRKKRFTSFPSPAGMSLTKLPLGRSNSVMTSLFPPRESLVVTSRQGTGNSRTFFLQCMYKTHVVKWDRCLGFHNP
jgi:hypothetical protein